MNTNKVKEQILIDWKKLEWLQTPDLKEISAVNLEKLKSSLKKNGFIQPFNIWWDSEREQYYILDGHHRRKAMLELETEGYTGFNCELPANVIECADRDEAIKYLLLYSSNYAIMSEDSLGKFLALEGISVSELEEISIQGIDIPNLFEIEEEEYEEESTDDLDSNVADADEIETDIVVGDVFDIGSHRLICGNSESQSVITDLMGGDIASVVYTDPPYGVSYQSNMRTATKKFDVLENDDVFITDWIKYLDTFSKGFVFVWTSWKVLDKWMEIMKDFSELSNMVIWSKGGGGIGDLKRTFSSDFEVALVFHRGAELKGKRIGSVWEVKKDNPSSYVHPTQKPVELCLTALEAVSEKNDIVLDLFLGSGSTMVACQKAGRRCRGAELSPKYVEVIVRRMKKTFPRIKIVRNGIDESEMWAEKVGVDVADDF